MQTKKPARPAVKLIDGHATTTSLAVAQYFGRRHKDVLRAIENIKAECPAEYHERNFAPMVLEVDIGSGATRKDPAYQLTRDGFTLLAMGFTGKAALAWKIKYIEAFNKLEARANSRAIAQAVRKQLGGTVKPSVRYHYPASLLNQPYFANPETGKTTLRPYMLADDVHYVSPLMALLNQIRSEGHEITGPFDEAIAMRQGLRQTCEALDSVSEAARKGQFGGIFV